jgi:hypothetical protein
VGIAAEQPCTRLIEDVGHQRLHPLEGLARLDQRARDRWRCRPEPLRDPPHHRRGVTADGPRRRHQLTITADQGVTRLGRPRLTANEEVAT